MNYFLKMSWEWTGVSTCSNVFCLSYYLLFYDINPCSSSCGAVYSRPSIFAGFTPKTGSLLSHHKNISHIAFEIAVRKNGIKMSKERIFKNVMFLTGNIESSINALISSYIIQCKKKKIRALTIPVINIQSISCRKYDLHQFG